MACEPCSSSGGDQGLAADGGSDAQPCLVPPALERGLADPRWSRRPRAWRGPRRRRRSPSAQWRRCGHRWSSVRPGMPSTSALPGLPAVTV